MGKLIRSFKFKMLLASENRKHILLIFFNKLTEVQLYQFLETGKYPPLRLNPDEILALKGRGSTLKGLRESWRVYKASLYAKNMEVVRKRENGRFSITFKY
ncbi:MAG: hypothetical protein H6621_02300 [Halobacteriovoraceae bacterium]|nr:hypothetical protein [Halobacteriovoraceae bacterium]